MRAFCILMLTIGFLVWGPAAAQGPAASNGPSAPVLSPAQEARAQALFRELRCMVCQGEVLADSEADLAKDLKALIRFKIATGDSDQAIRTYLVSIYGETILLSPPLGSGTWLLWFGPLILLILGGAAAWFTMHRGAAQRLEEPLSPGDAEKLARTARK